MLTDLFRRRPTAAPRAEPLAVPIPDPAYAARARLLRLRDLLVRETRHAKPATRRWGEPSMFFFTPSRQAELEAARPVRAERGTFSSAELIAAELTALLSSVEVRRVARAIPGLRDAAESLALVLPAARELADLLAVPDDETILVLHPGSRTGYRLSVRGIADVAQFHVLLANAIVGEADDGLLAAPPLPSRFVTAYRDAHPVIPAGVPMVVSAQFQLFRPAALQTDGTIPAGFAGCAHWLWGKEPLAAVPRVDGERVVLLGEPAYRATWEVERRFPGLAADVRFLEVLTPFVVAERLGRLAGGPVPIRSESRPLERAKAA